VLAEYFGAELIFNEAVFENVKLLFEKRGIKMPESNRGQAMVPGNAVIFQNDSGTAPGMWLTKDQFTVVSMPGVPFEMKRLMEKQIIPHIKETFDCRTITKKTVLTQGLGETPLMEKIGVWEKGLVDQGIKLAYLPSVGMVRLRLSINGGEEKDNLKVLDAAIDELKLLIPSYIYGYNSDTLESVIGEMLKQKKLKLSTAESCTGGYISHLITSVSGSSEYYEGSLVSYSNNVKIDRIGVEEAVLKAYGAVSEEVVRQMVEKTCENFNTPCGIAVTGIAGPAGGSAEKPVGTAWIAIKIPNKTIAKKFIFGGNRARNIRITAITALNMLRKELKEI